MGEVKPVMVVGVDDSKYSYYALEWTLDHFFSDSYCPFKLVIVHARPPPTSIIGLAGPGAGDVIPIVEADLKRIGQKVIRKAQEMCNDKGVKDLAMEEIEGDPRNVMCDIVDKLHATIMVLGSHGYNAVKRAVLGSVSDYCAHHAHCSVMIVKRPKNMP